MADAPTAFPTVEAAWFWTMRALLARREGRPFLAGPCSPDVVVREVDRLYRCRRIGIEHAHALRIWGERGAPPPHWDRCAPLWREAMERLDFPLRQQGVIA